VNATERRIEAFVAKYTHAIAAQLRGDRVRLRLHAPARGSQGMTVRA